MKTQTQTLTYYVTHSRFILLKFELKKKKRKDSEVEKDTGLGGLLGRMV